jgi:hypothetical protein
LCQQFGVCRLGNQIGVRDGHLCYTQIAKCV